MIFMNKNFETNLRMINISESFQFFLKKKFIYYYNFDFYFLILKRLLK